MTEKICLPLKLLRMFTFGMIVVTAFHQRAANKHFAAQGGIHMAVIDTPTLDQYQAVERHSFIGHHLAAAAIVMGLQRLALYQMLSGTQCPFRLYSGDCMCVEF